MKTKDFTGFSGSLHIAQPKNLHVVHLTDVLLKLLQNIKLYFCNLDYNSNLTLFKRDSHFHF